MAEALFARDAQLQRFQTLLNRNGGAEFGYHGLAGLGKTSLLDGFEHLARRTTPYVVRFDFTRGSSGAATTSTAARTAKTPAPALLATILELEATKQSTPKPSLLLRILRRRPPSPFIPALEALGCRTDRRQPLVNVIWAFQSQVIGNTQTISGGQLLGDNSELPLSIPEAQV